MPKSRPIPREGVLRELSLRANRVNEKSRDLFWRQPNAWGVGVGLIESAPGQYTGEVGIWVKSPPRSLKKTFLSMTDYRHSRKGCQSRSLNARNLFHRGAAWTDLSQCTLKSKGKEYLLDTG